MDRTAWRTGDRLPSPGPANKPDDLYGRDHEPDPRDGIAARFDLERPRP
jgi:hypothetical protein